MRFLTELTVSCFNAGNFWCLSFLILRAGSSWELSKINFPLCWHPYMKTIRLISSSINGNVQSTKPSNPLKCSALIDHLLCLNQGRQQQNLNYHFLNFILFYCSIMFLQASSLNLKSENKDIFKIIFAFLSWKLKFAKRAV